MVVGTVDIINVCKMKMKDIIVKRTKDLCILIFMRRVRLEIIWVAK